ncbi:MAG TPA: HAD-IIB family hydrolase [Pseudomonadales bacterium]|nr:HAD-IIB family hydrolase [Pseudomonadales bacterium]
MARSSAGETMTARAGPAPPALVFTDLDGTLLDDDYRFDAAASALERIRALRIPLILTSSKTLPEMRGLRVALRLDDPLIFENGAGVAIPRGHFDATLEAAAGAPLEVEVFGPTYAELRAILVDLRERHRYPFRGFGDMSPTEVARHTGLDEVSAARARHRSGSEPGLWQGSTAQREDFIRDLARHDLRAVQGGRFLHVMPRVDKAEAMTYLTRLYRELWPDATLPVIAAGDSPNDLDMLRAADRAVVIRRPDGRWMSVEKSTARMEGIVRSQEPGPRGWAPSIHQILDELGL